MLHVLVIDDSATARQVMLQVLSRDPMLLVATAADPIIAMAKMAVQRPDVILLDLELPRMSGFDFLKKLMREDPIPVVVCATNANAGSVAAQRALDCGAVCCVAKPEIGVREFFEDSAGALLEALHAAVNLHERGPKVPPSRGRLSTRGETARATQPNPTPTTRIVAMGASVGGTEALRDILTALPQSAPPMLIVQHMPAGFTAAFAARLNATCAIEVKEAASGDCLRVGCALLAPGNRHLTVRRHGQTYVVELDESPPVSRHRPSVDVLFHSMAREVGPLGVGVILTGMGDDGADGLSAMRRAGAHTIAQDEKSSVVYGMPRAAVMRGAVIEVTPLHAMAWTILDRSAQAIGK